MQLNRVPTEQESASALARKTVTIHAAGTLVAEHPGHTSAELAQKKDCDRAAMARRLPDAEKSGTSIKRGQPRACTVTGRIALTWWPLLDRRA